jgi:HK97 family phage major capsid protein
MAVNVIDESRAGALIPTEAAASIVRAATAASAVMQLARRVQMSSRTLEAPVLSETVDAFFGESGGLKRTTSAAFEPTELRAEEIAAIAVADDDVLADSAFPIWTALEPEFAAAIARTLDKATLAGTNRPASWSPSILEGCSAGELVTSGADQAGGGIYGDLAALLDNLEGRGITPTGWIAQRKVKGMMRSARFTSGESLAAAMDLSQAFDVPITWDMQNALPAEVLAVAGEWSNAPAPF